jgi:hypothetical protein
MDLMTGKFSKGFMMKKFIADNVLLLCLAVLFCGCTQNTTQPTSMNMELKNAITDGKALFEAYNKQAGKETHHPAIQPAREKIPTFCELNYHPVVIEHTDNTAVYFIGEPKNSNQIAFGIHYKVIGDVVVPSTKKCFVLPPPEPGNSAVAAVISHVLSNYPTEFHVFLSLKHKKPIYVGTPAGRWCVDGAKIRKIN